MGKVYRDLEYVTNAAALQKLDLYLPDSSAKTLVVFIHGGAWISGDKVEVRGFLPHFSTRNIAVASVNYRLSTDPSIHFPTHVHDVAHAYAWLVHNATKYGLPTNRVSVVGHSVGAHTAGMLATGAFLKDVGVPDSHLPRGFVGLEGIYDVPNLVRKWPKYKAWFVDKAFTNEQSWEAGSPARRSVVIKSPWFLVHSQNDELVDMSQTAGFAGHLQEQKTKEEMAFEDFGSHDGVVDQPTESVLYYLDKFFSSVV